VFLYAQDDRLLDHLNGELVLARRPDDLELVRLRELIVAHAELTGSVTATALLGGWERAAGSFWRVAPRDEVAAIERAHEGTA
jgi:glutamate synthase domain-containing protein 3